MDNNDNDVSNKDYTRVINGGHSGNDNGVTISMVVIVMMWWGSVVGDDRQW